MEGGQAHAELPRKIRCSDGDLASEHPGEALGGNLLLGSSGAGPIDEPSPFGTGAL